MSPDEPDRPSPAAPPAKRSTARQQAYFLRCFGRCGKVSEAAARTGITPRTVQRWRAENPRFAARYEEVLEGRAEMLAGDAMMRASTISYKPYVYRGKHVASVERFNDRLTMYMLDRVDRARERAEDRADRRDRSAIERELEDRIVERVVVRLQDWVRKLSPSMRRQDPSSAS